MAKSRKKNYNQNTKNLLFFFIMLPILALTVFAMLQPQIIRQFAAGISAPPLFGCLHTGEADPTLCGTRMGQEGKNSLKVNTRPYVGQNIYYNDTVSGSFTYKNVGDQPIKIQNYGIAAGSFEQYYIATFKPLEGPTTLNPGQVLSSKESSYTFKTPDPSEGWVVGPGITNTDGQALPIKDSVTNIRVNSACTALRVKPLTARDKSNVQALCAKDPKNILCTSRQYCELFKGGQCSGPVLGEQRKDQQCDEDIVLDQKEQDVLEQLCKTYPDSDACKDFCKRAIGSKICPEELLWFDPNGKQVFPQPAKYMADAGTGTDPQVAGITTIAQAQGGTQALVGRCPGNQIDSGGGVTSYICTNPPGVIPPPAPAIPGLGLINVISGVQKIIKTIPLPGQKSYKASCASHRANDIGQCCASHYELINGCCQPGCFVYHSAPKSRLNCQYRNKSGVCCVKEDVEQFGYCRKAQAPKDLNGNPVPLPGDNTIPRDRVKIYPPNYVAPADRPVVAPPGGNNCSPAEISAGVCKGGSSNPAPANPAPANPAPVDSVPPCSVGDLNKKSDFDCLAKQKGYRNTYGACMEPVVIESQACYEKCRAGNPGDIFNQCVRDRGCQTTYDQKELACR